MRPRTILTILVALIALAAAAAAIYRRGPEPQAQKTRKVLYYVDPMHPSYRSGKPGVAPDCGMQLEPVYEDADAAAGAASFPPGTVNISPDKQQLIGIRFGEARTVALSRTIRTVGKVTYDETKIARIHAKYEGWVETIAADYVGKLVEKGQPLLEIYSPELVATQQEFLLALKARGYLGQSPVREVAAGANSLYDAARKRLELWDVTEEQIRELTRRNAPIRTLTLYAPLSGYILSRNVFPRQRITPETELYGIANLSTVWVLADFYESEAASVRTGQHARMTLSYYPGRSFHGTVTYINPQVDNTTRALKARLEFTNDFANGDLALKPDMYANVEIVVDYGRQLAIPEEAVLDSGLEATVFVDRGNGYLEPRRVLLGEKVDKMYVVRQGLGEGERVVTSANFLVDSESRLKSALAGIGAGGAHQHGTAAAEPAPAAKPAGRPQQEHKH